MEISSINDSSFKVLINSELYSIEVIHKSIYWLLKSCSASIDINDGIYEVLFTDIKSDINVDVLIERLKINLIDFKTREIIQHETKNIREMLIAKAFSNGDELDEPEPAGNIINPLGTA